ncbi:MAG: bacteriohemerythrin [Pseudodesulfovibrio sp.]|jgi:hemerythrin|uniref:Hemerythrin n=1 Tax=Pseudodesulfovibrio indicus TaxID=1716143 RepID=A0A126QQU9_9BACT|nr:hemerythrin family protein [Pseudodesulfovibrio indicus]AMK12420.1 hemerythrin [Pseudodesulfovibrio indicus]TDT90720.1 hemerythrin [Pseudodesulfovibrio indicus]
MPATPAPAEFPEDLTLGIRELDDQHKTLFAVLDRILAVSRDPYRQLDDDGTNTVLDIMTDLKDAAMQHFDQEETLMDQRDYPGLDDQQEAHERFLDDLVRIEADLMNGTAVPPVRLHADLADQLAAHVREMDRELAQFLNKSEK